MVRIIFIVRERPSCCMKPVVIIVAVFLFMMLSAGCTSHMTTSSNITTQVPGPVATLMTDSAPPTTATVGQTNVSPGMGNRTNTTQEEAFFLEPVKAYHVGETITLHGATILSAGDPLLVEVVSSSFGPAPKSSSQSFTGVSGIAPVVEGRPGGPNSWSFSFPTDGFIEDTYIVTVSGITVNVRDSTTFLLQSRL